METFLLLYTEPPTRRIFADFRPGRLVFASDAITPQDREIYDECVSLPPVAELEETLSRLDPLSFDRLVVQTEYGLLPGVLLAKSRGLPAPSAEAAFLCTNKWLCRRVLERAGVRVPACARVETAQDVRRFAQRLPVVLKPVASTLARGVVRVDSEKEIEERVGEMRAALPAAPDVLRLLAFARLAGIDMDCQPSRQFLVEEYVDGTPLETDGLLFGDRIDLFGVTEQVVSPPPRFFLEGYLFPGGDGADAVGATEASIRALGLRDAGFSIEFRGGVLIEVNARLGEDDGLPELFRAALGSFPLRKWIEGDATPSRPSGCHALAYANAYRGGLVRSVPPSGNATVLVRPGMRLRAPPHPECAPHLAYAIASHPTSARVAYDRARAAVERLRFEIEEDSSDTLQDRPERLRAGVAD